MDLREQLQSGLGTAYVIERELGGGGMSRVFVATETALGRKVVIKVLPPWFGADFNLERFRREIHLAASLQHPHIVPLHAAGEAGDLLYYTMPLVEGESLRARLIRDGELPIEEVVRILREVLDALSYAHSHGVVHRDIKPDNVLLSGQHAVVTDFGVAKALGDATGAAPVTVTGMAIGTPAYMAPEQVAADPHVDQRADIYSLGAMGYELLTGQPPFAGPNPQVVLAAQVGQTPQPIAARRPACPAGLSTALMKCLAKDPADRPQTAAEVVRLLEEAPPTSSPSPVRERGQGGEVTVSEPGPGRVVIRRWALTAAGVIALLGVGAVAAYRTQTAVPAGVSKSVAVLPFVNVGGDSTQEYFSDGMTDELIGALGKVPGLRVAARSSAFSFKGKQTDLREIGAKLNVATVLEGTVRRSGAKLRVTVQLVNVRDGLTLWSETYARELADVFEVQEEIAQTTVGALKLALGAPAAPLAKAGTASLEAHDLYLKGRYAWNQRTANSLVQAVRYFEQAIARDPGYAQAYAGLADVYVVQPFSGDAGAPGESWRRAQAAAHRALELDSSLAEAHTTLAYGKALYEWNWTEAEAAFRRAIAADSTYPTAHQWYADFLTGRGRLEEALLEFRKAQTLDPLSPVINQELGWVLTDLHRYDEALEQIQETVRLEPGFLYAWLQMSVVLTLQGKHAEAMTAIKQASAISGGSDDEVNAYLIYVLARSGQRDSALRVLEGLSAKSTQEYLSPFLFAVGFASVGDQDQAFAALDRAIAQRDGILEENLFDPMLEPLHNDPRWRRVLERMGITAP